MNGLRSSIGICGFHEPKLQPFQKTSMRPDIIFFGTRKFIDRDPHSYPSRVKEDTHIRLHPNNINRDSEIESLKRGCLHVRSDSTIADQHLRGPLKNNILL